jgi:hypothetical protein
VGVHCGAMKKKLTFLRSRVRLNLHFVEGCFHLEWERRHFIFEKLLRDFKCKKFPDVYSYSPGKNEN